MKTNKITAIAAIVFFTIINTTFAQRERRDNDRNNRDENYDTDRSNRDNRNDNYDRSDRNNRNDRRDRNEYDRDDNDRIREYERGGNNFRRNPYDYRNLPNDWSRQRNSRFDWYRFDWDNRYDPRYSNRDLYDLYFPWDPSNPYDIRNQRNYYGNNQYWNGRRPNRIVIVPPIIRYGHPAWGHRNNGRNKGHHGKRW